MKRKDAINVTAIILIIALIYFYFRERERNKVLRLNNSSLAQQGDRLRNALFKEYDESDTFYKIKKPKEQVQYIVKLLDTQRSYFLDSNSEFISSFDDSIHNLKGEKMDLAYGALFIIVERTISNSLSKNENFKKCFEKILHKGGEVMFGRVLEFMRNNEIISLKEFDRMWELKELRDTSFHRISKNDSGIISQIYQLLAYIQEYVVDKRLSSIEDEELTINVFETEETQLTLCD